MRLFTFGCSMTEYPWPTWADILVHDLQSKGHTAENWGKCGAGNQYIFAKIMECHLKNNLGPNDWVLVCWTSFFRNDYYVEDRGWYLPGKLQDNTVIHHKRKDTKYHIDPSHYAMRDCASIAAVKLMLESLGVNLVFWYWNDLHIPDADLAKHEKLNFDKVVNEYSKFISTDVPIMKGLNYRNYKFKSFWPGQSPIAEVHPTPADYLEFIKESLADKIPWINLSDETQQFVNTWQDKILSFKGVVDLGNTGWKAPEVKQWQ